MYVHISEWKNVEKYQGWGWGYKGSKEVIGAQHSFVSEVASFYSAHLVDEGKLALDPRLTLQHIPHVLQLEHRVPVSEIYGEVFDLLQDVEKADDHSHYFVLKVLDAVEVHLLAEVAVRQLLHFPLVFAGTEADLLIGLGLGLEKVGLSEFLGFWVGDCQFLQKGRVVEPGLKEGKGIIVVQEPRGKFQSKLAKIQPSHLTVFNKLKNVILHLPHCKILLKHPMCDLHADFLPVQASPSHLYKSKYPHEVIMRATREMVGVQPNHSQTGVAIIQTLLQDFDDECQVIIADIETVEDQFEDGKLGA